MQLKSVVLPAPFGPIRPTMRPGATPKETPSSATMPPKRTRTSCTRSSAAVSCETLISSSRKRALNPLSVSSDWRTMFSNESRTMQQRFPRVNATPAYPQVAEAIERQILAGRVRPGDPLGTEAELVKEFGVNRSTVREGIRLLEQSGLVRRDSSRRLWIGLPHYERLAKRMSRALVLHEVTFRELYEAAMPIQIATVEAAR